jgi:hypothetical protein
MGEHALNRDGDYSYHLARVSRSRPTQRCQSIPLGQDNPAQVDSIGLASSAVWSVEGRDRFIAPLDANPSAPRSGLPGGAMRFAHCAHPGLGRNGSSGSTTAGQWISPRLRRLTKSPTRLAVARGLPA